MAYAATTTVSVEKSRAEIEATLARYGADAFGYMTDGPDVKIAFRMKDRRFRFSLVLPDKREKRFTHSSRGLRSTDVALKEWEQACRQKWRALALVIKAKLEAVDAGISSLEDEFLSNLILPSGESVGEWVKPQVEQAYLTGTMPRHLQLTGPA